MAFMKKLNHIFLCNFLKRLERMCGARCLGLVSAKAACCDETMDGDTFSSLMDTLLQLSITGYANLCSTAHVHGQMRFIQRARTYVLHFFVALYTCFILHSFCFFKTGVFHGVSYCILPHRELLRRHWFM